MAWAESFLLGSENNIIRRGGWWGCLYLRGGGMKEGSLCCDRELSLSVVRLREEMPDMGAGLLPSGRGVDEMELQ